MLAKEYITPSKSPYASSFFFIKKKDRKLQPVQDYREINKWTITNQYPLPLIGELIDDLSAAHIFTKLDVREGYNNVRVKDGDQHKMAFKTAWGLHEPEVLFFGAKTAPSTFMAFMNEVFYPVIQAFATLGTIIRVYMDDIAIATTTTRPGT